MQSSVARQEKRDEEKRQAILAEKAAIKAAKKPKKEATEEVENWKIQCNYLRVNQF